MAKAMASGRATTATVVPAIADQVQHVTVLQRSPTYFDGISICAPAMSVSSRATIAAALREGS